MSRQLVGGKERELAKHPNLHHFIQMKFKNQSPVSYKCIMNTLVSASHDEDVGLDFWEAKIFFPPPQRGAGT